MKAYLIYHREEARRNEAFIRLFQEAGRECGMDFSYVPYDDYRKKALPDLVLNRTRDFKVSIWYEEKGIPVYHSSLVTELGNHKGKTLAFLQEHLSSEILAGKWAPETLFVSRERLMQWQAHFAKGDFDAVEELAAYQEEEKSFVIKSVDGHGGSEVMAFLPLARSEWAHTPSVYWKNLAMDLKKLAGKDCLLQEKIESESRDVRVYILGNQIYQGILRQGRKDFRSNYSLGGRTEVYAFSEEEKEFVEAFLQAFCGEALGLVGLDFLVAADGSLIFNELEEMVGCRMLYRNTGRNIVRDYVLWLRERLS